MYLKNRTKKKKVINDIIQYHLQKLEYMQKHMLSKYMRAKKSTTNKLECLLMMGKMGKGVREKGKVGGREGGREEGKEEGKGRKREREGGTEE